MKLFFLVFLTITTYCSGIEVKTRLGNIIGTERKSRDGKIYHAFTKIPYAKPPLGNLRLKNPVPADPWKGTYNATEQLPMCIQVHTFIPKIRKLLMGVEDCLYLNVYTPDVSPAEKLPVLIHVHGGAFRMGNAGTPDVADFLIDENVVMVTLHYRLATLGFLSTENSIIPGNFGLKDQAMAVKWVHKNIDSFGGDPNKITVFGESAGGASTDYLGMSPLTKDIIRGVISESGLVNNFWGFDTAGKSRPVALQVAEKLGCNKPSDEEMLICLQKLDAKQLINVELEFIFWDFDPCVVFKPVQEPEGEGAFLPFNPLKMETSFPLLAGFVSNEGIVKKASLIAQDDSVTQAFMDHIDNYIPRLLFQNVSDPLVRRSTELLKNHYFPIPTIEVAQNGIGRLYQDGLFIYPILENLSRHKGPLYLYLFDYRGANTIIDPLIELNLGPTHTDETLMIMNFTAIFPKFKAGDEKVSRRMVKMWADFARTQNPTPDGDPVWPEGSSTGEYLHITERFTVKKNLKKDVLTWWSNLPMFKTSEKN